MDHATVALLLALSRAAIYAGATAATFGYPDDDHVIITQYGPVRYEPMSADQLNRPYDYGDVVAKIAPARGYFKAEVIPLDMKTWKPLPGGGGDAAEGGRWAGGGSSVGGRAGPGPGRAGGTGAGPGRFGGGGGGGGEFDTFDVPLRVGYSVRPTKPKRRRRHDYFLTSPPGRSHRYPGSRSPSRIAVTQDLWRR